MAARILVPAGVVAGCLSAQGFVVVNPAVGVRPGAVSHPRSTLAPVRDFSSAVAKRPTAPVWADPSCLHPESGSRRRLHAPSMSSQEYKHGARQQTVWPAVVADASRGRVAAAPGRLGRLRSHVSNAFRKFFLGYDPAQEEEDNDFSERRRAAAMTGLQGQVDVPRPEEAAAVAGGARAGTKMAGDEEEEDMLMELVKLDVFRRRAPTDDEFMASLRRRIEKGPEDEHVNLGDMGVDEIEEEKAEILERQLTEGSVGPAVREGERRREWECGAVAAAVASAAAAEEGKKKTKTTTFRAHQPETPPKLVSAEDAERLRRMFGGSLGGGDDDSEEE